MEPLAAGDTGASTWTANHNNMIITLACLQSVRTQDMCQSHALLKALDHYNYKHEITIIFKHRMRLVGYGQLRNTVYSENEQ